MERLKKQNMTTLLNLEKFMQILKKNQKNDALVKALQQSIDDGELVLDITGLKDLMTPLQYQKIVKSVA